MSRHVEGRNPGGVKLDGYSPRFTRFKLDALPSGEALEWLSGGGGQGDVELRDLCAGDWAGICETEANRACDGVDGEVRVLESGVGKPVTEREQRLAMLDLEPAVADRQSLGVRHFKTRVSILVEFAPRLVLGGHAGNAG